MNTEELVIIGRVEDERDEAAAERDAYREALALALERLHRIETARQRVVRRRREARGRTAA